jgi:hypothetical protein
MKSRNNDKNYINEFLAPELIIKIAFFLDEKDQFSLLRASNKMLEQYPGLKERHTWIKAESNWTPHTLSQQINWFNHYLIDACTYLSPWIVAGVALGLFGLGFSFVRSSLLGAGISSGLTFFSVGTELKNRKDRCKEMTELELLRKLIS